MGISVTSSINKVPLLALSKTPKEIVPSANSCPNNSFRKFFLLVKQHLLQQMVFYF